MIYLCEICILYPWLLECFEAHSSEQFRSVSQHLIYQLDKMAPKHTIKLWNGKPAFGWFSCHGKNHSQQILTIGILIRILAASTTYMVAFFCKRIAASSFCNDRNSPSEQIIFTEIYQPVKVWYCKRIVRINWGGGGGGRGLGSVQNTTFKQR